MKKLKSMFSSTVGKVSVGTGLMVAAATSQAAAVTVDMGDVLSTLAAAVITVTAVCTAAISIVVVIRVFKYVRAAF